MEDEIFGAQREGALGFSTKRLNRLFEKYLVRRCEIDEVIGMNDQRLQIIAIAQPRHFIALRSTKLVGCPLPGTRGKDLERIAAQAIGALCCILHTAGGRSVNADA